MNRQSYSTDLREAQWKRLQPLLEAARSRRGYALREIVNGMLYVLRCGIARQAMPHDLPPWESVYDHFRRWKKKTARWNASTTCCAKRAGRSRAGSEAPPPRFWTARA